MATLAAFPDQGGQTKTYSVKKISRAISLTGRGDDPGWQQARVLTDFSYPWEKDKPLTTKFRALHNDDWLYCLFDVTDHHVVLATDPDDKSAVASSTRAEIFFRIDEKLAPYFCLELDPQGRVLDYKATYYRKFDSSWSWPAGHLILKTSRTKDGYTIEAAISKKSLAKLGVLNDNTLQAGLFRADCLEAGNSDANFKGVSWVKPDSEKPDFHIPSSFGLLVLED
ncbi:MAG TPA: carbohydrate-binding family 9-like protein [Chryseosolibacter sp.]